MEHWKVSKPSWLPEMDRLLAIGMKHGPKAIRQVRVRLRQLVPALTPGEIWKRMRYLRERGSNGHRNPSQWAPEIIQLLKEGYRHGGSKKQEALKIFREHYPGVAGSVISRFARCEGWPEGAPKASSTRLLRRPWTRHEDELLRRLAGYDSPRQIAHKLRRTERAVRFRLAAQGLSGSVKDGVSLRVFRHMFHIGHRKASALIANGILKVRDSRISSSSLAQFCTKHEASLEPVAINRIKGELQKPAIGFSWERAASLVGISVDQLRALVAEGQLRVVDTFVTDKAFEEFCCNCGRNDAPQVNLPLMRPEILEWLVKDYGFVISSTAASQSAPRAVKHALVVRVCARCKKEIRGNVYFAHIKTCRAMLVVGR